MIKTTYFWMREPPRDLMRGKSDDPKWIYPNRVKADGRVLPESFDTREEAIAALEEFEKNLNEFFFHFKSGCLILSPPSGKSYYFFIRHVALVYKDA